MKKNCKCINITNKNVVSNTKQVKKRRPRRKPRLIAGSNPNANNKIIQPIIQYRYLTPQNQQNQQQQQQNQPTTSHNFNKIENSLEYIQNEIKAGRRINPTFKNPIIPPTIAKFPSYIPPVFSVPKLQPEPPKKKKKIIIFDSDTEEQEEKASDDFPPEEEKADDDDDDVAIEENEQNTRLSMEDANISPEIKTKPIKSTSMFRNLYDKVTTPNKKVAVTSSRSRQPYLTELQQTGMNPITGRIDGRTKAGRALLAQKRKKQRIIEFMRK